LLLLKAQLHHFNNANCHLSAKIAFAGNKFFKKSVFFSNLLDRE